jgi:hypothetical protein
MTTIIILTGNRTTSECITLEKKTEKLSVYQKAVGGYIETLGQGSGWQCYVNEEGLIKDLPQNEAAAMLMHKLVKYNGIVYGPAVFVFTKNTSPAFKLTKSWFALYQNNMLPFQSEYSDDDEDIDDDEDEDYEDEN